MAHQTSKVLQKQSTPHSIGRLMDADFAGIIIESGVATTCSSSKPTSGQPIKSRKVQRDVVPAFAFPNQ
jgi:hypothetical protein